MGTNIKLDRKEKIRINLYMEVSALKANYDKLVVLKVLFDRFWSKKMKKTSKMKPIINEKWPYSEIATATNI